LNLNPQGRGILDQVVRNVGPGSANDVQIDDVDPTFGGRAHRSWNPNVLQEIRYIPPGHLYRFLVTAAAAFEPMDEPVRVDARYKSKSGEQFVSTFLLDDQPLRRSIATDPPLVRIAESLQQITFALTQTGIGQRGVHDPSPRIRVELVRPRNKC